MPPAVLYKYTSAETGLMVLGSGKLRWSSPRVFNDPSEFQRVPRFEPSLKDSLTLLPKVIVESAIGAEPLNEELLFGMAKKMHQLVRYSIEHGVDPEAFREDFEHPEEAPDSAYAEMMRQFFGDNFIKQARVLCLTANPSNSAMWANYSEQHAGCLLGFRHVMEKDTPLQEAKEVSYSESPPVVGSGLEFLLYGGTPEILGMSMDGMCFAKKSEWSYEQEWRVVTWRSDEGEELYGDYPFFPEELESVTFGLHASPSTRDAVADIVARKYPSCDLYQMVLEEGNLERRRV